MGKGEAVVATEGTEARASTSGRARMVVAADHSLASGVLKELLGQQQDLEVVGEAHDGCDVLELCRRLLPEVVLIEAPTPKIDGIEATRRIKREFPWIPVLVVDSLGDPDRLLEAIEAGAAGYVLKSSGPRAIGDAVRGALMGENPLDGETTMRLLRRLADETSN
jgi:DNA-binding NarL/FixJ family response regulator